MKPTLVADEMFPEGAGPFMELDEVSDVAFLRETKRIKQR